MKILILFYSFYFAVETSCQSFNGNLLTTVTHFTSARSVASSYNYSETAVGFQNGEIKIFNNSGSFLRSFNTQFGNGINSIVYLENGDIATAGFAGAKLYTYDGYLKQTFTSIQSNTIITLKNGDLAFNSMSEIFIWNPDSNVHKLKLTGHTGVVFSLLVLSNGDLMSGAEDGTIKIWDISSGSLKKTLTDSNGWTRSLVLLDNGFVASGSDFGKVTVWDVDSGKEILGFKTDHKGLLTSIALLPNGQLASSSMDKLIKIWNIDNGNLVKTISDGHSDWIMQIIFNSDNYLVSVGYDGNISFWK